MVKIWFTIIHKLVENVEQNRLKWFKESILGDLTNQIENISKKHGDAANNCQLNSNFIRML